jgi:hypothetical protein
MATNEARSHGRIPWWVFAMDDEWAAYGWYLYDLLDERGCPSEFADAMTEERARSAARSEESAAAGTVRLSAVSRLLLGLASRLRGRQVLGGATTASRAQNLSLGAER